VGGFGNFQKKYEFEKKNMNSKKKMNSKKMTKKMCSTFFGKNGDFQEISAKTQKWKFGDLCHDAGDLCHMAGDLCHAAGDSWKTHGNVSEMSRVLARTDGILSGLRPAPKERE
jgi:hypothetical protein